LLNPIANLTITKSFGCSVA